MNFTEGNAGNEVKGEKAKLRGQIRSIVEQRTKDARFNLSQLACDNLLKNLKGAASKSVLLYMPLRDELDVQPLLVKAQEMGWQVALPRFIPETGRYGAFFVGAAPLAAGPYGILEPDPSLPIPVNRLDLVVVPGLAFDARGRRLGRGKGFYDRLLAEAGGVVKCGICFDEQLLPEIPAEPHDVAVDFIATPTRWLVCRGAPPEL